MGGKQDIDAVLSELAQDRGFVDAVTRWERIPAREGSFAEIPGELHSALRESLQARGITQLYTHQRQAYDRVREGRDVVVVTPTASGKTLCYNLPVLQRILEEPDARALYLFPTKALSQDQQAELNTVVDDGRRMPIKIATYDGDTPQSLRASARDTGQIIISNPDMLHSGILPNHPRWIKFLGALRYVVIDEIHTYRGVFGSHMTNVIRRLRRIARFYGADPIFVCCSATIANPGRLAESIVERPVELIDTNGAPAGEKHLILYNPPFVDRVQGIRRGAVHESRRLALRFLKSGIKTIVFARSRLRTEIIASYINKSLANVYTENSRIRVESYRGGYLPNERRAIERGLREGSIHGVVSTNALELGIDIGGLDVAILAGFPGSIASSMQQAGRAGRSQSLSVAVLIASAAPLDQYMVGNPEYFLGRNPEAAYIDPNNPYILTDHLKCAVFELPMKSGDEYAGPGRADGADAALAYLEEEGVLRYTAGTYYWADRSYPAEQISLRSATADNVVIVNTTGGRHEVIGETDRPAAKEELYTNAIYLHRGTQYVVKQLDLENKRCYVEESDAGYYTDAVVKRDIKVLEEDVRVPASGVLSTLGDVLVRTQVAKFKKIRFQTHENVGFGEIALAEEEMHTRAAVLLFAPGTEGGAALEALSAEYRMPAVSRIGGLIKNVAPVFLLCDGRDIGVAERLRDPHYGLPCLYVYDNYPGGIGLAEAFLERMPEILQAALELVSACPCAEGCPSCVGPRNSEEEIDADPKAAVQSLLHAWVGGASHEPA